VTFRLAGGPPERAAAPGKFAARGSDELARLYAEHSRPLVQLAALLVTDIGTAREIMYEAFAALERGRSRPHRSDDAFAFLLRAVVHRARTAAVPPAAGAPDHALGGDAVLNALRTLPGPQREALVLRYYGELSDEQAAAALDVRPGELIANVARGMAALRAALTSSGRKPPG
jgi:DNA-directed RNA polymerase specialized sigma24 family protein